jgi:hypothetical protein
MNKIKREDFEKWMKKHDFFKFNEAGTVDGQQHHYLTPAGETLIVQYDLQGCVAQLIKLVAMPIQATQPGPFPLKGLGRT